MKTPLLAILCLLPSCTLLVPITFHPETNNLRTSLVEHDSITVYLEHIDVNYDHLILDLEVINHSSDTIPLSPHMISFFASNNLFTSLADSYQDVNELSAPNSQLTGKKKYGRKPDDIKNLYEQRLRAKATVGAIFTLFSIAVAVYDIAQDTKDSRKESWTEKDNDNAIARDALVSATFITTDAINKSLRYQTHNYQYLRHEFFPEGIIEPKKSVRGKVFLPDDNMFNYYRIVIPVNEFDFVFDFRRRGTKR